MAKELGENLTDEEIQEMIDEADRGMCPTGKRKKMSNRERKRERKKKSEDNQPTKNECFFSCCSCGPLDGDGEINEEEFLRIMKKTSLY